MKDLSLHILDLTHNSISARASCIEIKIREDLQTDLYEIVIQDNGKGIEPEMLATVTDPFTTSRKSRKVGMGLALFKQNAEQTGGGLTIISTPGKGTCVSTTFKFSNIDRPPIGDISGVVVNLAAACPKIQFIYTHITQKGSYHFDTCEIIDTLDGIPLSDQVIRKYLIEMLDENLDEIGITR